MQNEIIIDTIYQRIFDTVPVFKVVSFPDTIKVMSFINSLSTDISNSKSDYLPLIITSIISICALLVSFTMLYRNYKHYKLISKPFLNVFFSRCEKSFISVSITNKGVGPAILQGMDYTSRQGQQYFNAAINLNHPVTDYIEELRSIGKISFSGFTKGAYIGVGETVDLIKIVNESISEGQKNMFDNIMMEIDFVIHYKSCYKDNFVTKSSKAILSQIHFKNI